MKAFFQSDAGKAFTARQRAKTEPGLLRAWANQHGLTKEQLQALSESQNQSCAICKEVSKLCVDHNHSTGKVRGLLCHRCNSGLGFFRDSPLFLRSAASYLDS